MTTFGPVQRCMVAFLIACLICPPGLALESPPNASLRGAIAAALRSDPLLQAAGAQQRVDAEALPKARAELLPRLSFQASQSQNTTTSQNFTSSGLRTPTETSSYDSKSKSVQMNQPLIRPRAWMGYLQGQTVVSAADATYEAATQQAINKVVGAYMDKLRLEFELEAARVNESALELRQTYVRRLAQEGRASRVDLRSAEANYAQGGAHTLETSATLIAALGELGRMTGVEWKIGQGGITDIKKAALTVAEIIERRLRESAALEVEQHPEVMARRLRLDAAEWEVKKRGSDHSPTLDLIASVSEGDSASDISIGRHAKTRAVGVQLSVPLYSGGAVTSSVRESVAMMEKAEMELKNARLMVANERRRNASQLKAAILSLRAALASLEAAELSVRQLNIGVSMGVNSEVELKDVLSRKAGGESALATTLAKAVSVYSNLHLSQGSLNIDEMAELSAALE